MNKDFFIWLRDSAARVLASATAFSFMWIAVGLAIAVGYYWDGLWSRDQAPEGLALSFQAGGWVVRTWTVFALVGAVALFRQGGNILASIVLLTWLGTSVMAYGHVLGFIASGQAERYASGVAVEQKASITEMSVDDKLALIERQKAEVRADRDSDVQSLEQALDALINDGSAANDKDATDTYTALIGEVRRDARSKLDALAQQETDLLRQEQDTKLEVNEEQVTAVKFDPLYTWLAGWLYGTPTEANMRSIAQRVGAFWAFLIELIGGAGPAILYAAHAHFSDKSEAQRNAEKAAEFERRSAAAKKGAATRRRGNKIEMSKRWYEERVKTVLSMRRQGFTVEEVARSFGWSIDGMRMYLKDYVTSDQLDFIFKKEAKPELEPQPSQDEAEILDTGDSDADESDSNRPDQNV